MINLSGPRRVARRNLLIATTVAGLMLAGAPLAEAATTAAPASAASALTAASPGTGIPVLGGLIDSIVGILTGTVHGIAGAAGAVSCSVAPVCPPVAAS
jgi:hypothetical protein